MYLIRIWLVRRTFNKLSLAVSEVAEKSTERRAKAMLAAESRMPMDVGVDVLSRALLSAGRFSEVVRFRSEDTEVVAAPIAQPFEPQLLDERDGTFHTIESIDDDRMDPPANFSWRKLRDARRWPVWFRVIWILLILLWLRWSWGATADFAFFAVFLVGLTIVMNLIYRGGKQWIVVPGGVVLREGGFLKRNIDLVLLTPADTALAVGELKSDRWQVCAANSGGSFKKEFTRREADLLVRAWCSPLPPPSVEQLSDLR